ncbi:CDP-glycerol glycerophosphotransferase family protein [Mollicutes bacterium LVI A0039]|nr:CDP-glycerol glycerophosphotransferase family protein [Mollicutes bacterium LVI A0039]
MNKLLTIGIVTYEETIYLYELLSNLSKQFRDYNLHDKCEVIIVNDGGKNQETLDILESFANEFTVVINTTNTKSPSDARNAIINKSASKYLLFMDGDDNFIDSIEALCDELEASDTKDIFVSRVKKIVNEGAIVDATFIYTHNLFSMSDDRFAKEHHKMAIHQTGVWSIYNVQFLRDNNIYYEPKLRYEDNIFMSKIALTENVRYGRVFTAYYGWRVNLQSFSHTDNQKIIEYRLQLFKKTLELISKKPDNKFSPYLLYSVWNQTYGNIMRSYPSSFTDQDFREYLQQLNKISAEHKGLIKQMLAKTDDYVQVPYRLKKIKKNFREVFVFIKLKMKLNDLKNKRITILKNCLKALCWLPLNSKKIFLTSQYGKYNDNTKYLYLQMKADPKYKNYKFVFAVKDPALYKNNSDFINYDNKLQFYFHHYTAKYIYFNTWIDGGLKKRKNQLWTQLWHGYPYKKVFRDIENFDKNTPPGKLQNKLNSIKNWDYIWSVDQNNTQIFNNLFPNVEIIEQEYPKIQWLIDNQQDDKLISTLKHKFGLKEGEKYALYAPTYRPYYYAFDMAEVRKQIPQGYKLVIHLHPYVTANLVNPSESDIFLSNIKDVQEVVLATDALITDYSSLKSDYYAINKEVIEYCPDLELYTKVHGLYPNSK